MLVVLALAPTAVACASTTSASSGAPTETASVSTNTHHRKAHHTAHPQVVAPTVKGGPVVPRVDLPNRALTPGGILTHSAAVVCRPGYASSVRNVPTAESDAVYARYHVAHVPYAHEVDHLVSLELGGSNAIQNLWPEPYAGRWGARTKDRLENTLHDLVCAGRVALPAAQHIEATNWVAAYRRYVSASPPPTTGGGSGPVSAGGYYASSYPTARTIYCADDPEWRQLSTRYLVRFGTLAQARRRFPGYHLHQPC